MWPLNQFMFTDSTEPASGDGCDDKEKKYIAKVQKKFGADAAKFAKEAARLQKMQGGKMKPELLQGQEMVSVLEAGSERVPAAAVVALHNGMGPAPGEPLLRWNRT